MIEVDEAVGGATEIFVPNWRYPDGVSLSLSGVQADWIHDTVSQIVRVKASGAGSLKIELAAG